MDIRKARSVVWNGQILFGHVNVNIKMTKKWKIKMYIFQDLLLSL